MASPKLIIVSRRPGLIRGGVAHPAAREHALDAFTAAQLRDIVEEPDLTAVIGDLVTGEHVKRAEAAEAEAAAGAAKKGAKKDA